MGVYRAEYIWIDGTQPTQKLRSKTKIVPKGEKPPIWGFDGSSTQQATGDRSDCVLQPVFSCPDPIRGGDDLLVLCEVMLVSGQPHPSNMRRANADMAGRYASFDTWFGIEQEYTLFRGMRPLGFPDSGFPAPQGGYYCGVGADEVFGREVVEAHLDACLKAGLKISGINAEVMPGQWEFQVGPINAPQIGDQLWLARWLLYRVGEPFGVSATLYPKHELLDQRDAPGLRRLHRGGRGARHATRPPHRELRIRDRGAPHRAPRDVLLQGVPLRRERPRRVGAHPVAGREGPAGLHRGSPTERQCRSLRDDASHPRDRLWRTRVKASSGREAAGRPCRQATERETKKGRGIG